jgi:hypothetical protein
MASHLQTTTDATQDRYFPLLESRQGWKLNGPRIVHF